MISLRANPLFIVGICIAIALAASAGAVSAQTWESVKLKSGAVSYGQISGGGDAVTVEGKFTDTTRTYEVVEEKEKFFRISDGTNSGWVFKISVEPVDAESVPEKLGQGSTTDPLVGKRVVVIRDKSPLQVSGREVAKAADCSVFTVTSVQGDWLWIAAQKGYLRRSDVVLFDEAISYYTRQLEASKTARNYWNRAHIWRLKGELDIAIGDMNEAIRLNPSEGAWFVSRGLLWKGKIDYDKAIVDYSEAIRLNPKNGVAYDNRGTSWDAKQEYNKAISDYTDALKFTDSNLQVGILGESEITGSDSDTMVNSRAFTLNRRGGLWSKIGDYGKALADIEEAIRLDPRYDRPYINRHLIWEMQGAWDKVLADCESITEKGTQTGALLNSFAWFLSTCPNEKYRNGARAVELATKACEITNWHDANDLGTLAATYAEVGDYEKAVEMQKKAIALAPNDEAENMRLALYQSNQPYRQPDPQAVTEGK